MKRLFNEYEAYTEDGNNLDKEFSPLVRNLIDRYTAMGYSVRDIENVLSDSIYEHCSYSRLSRAMKKYENRDK